MTAEQLIQILQKLPKTRKIVVASDEEWNTIFDDIDIITDTETHKTILFGLSGSEVEQI